MAAWQACSSLGMHAQTYANLPNSHWGPVVQQACGLWVSCCAGCHRQPCWFTNLAQQQAAVLSLCRFGDCKHLLRFIHATGWSVWGCCGRAYASGQSAPLLLCVALLQEGCKFVLSVVDQVQSRHTSRCWPVPGPTAVVCAAHYRLHGDVCRTMRHVMLHCPCMFMSSSVLLRLCAWAGYASCSVEAGALHPERACALCGVVGCCMHTVLLQGGRGSLVLMGWPSKCTLLVACALSASLPRMGMTHRRCCRQSAVVALQATAHAAGTQLAACLLGIG